MWACESSHKCVPNNITYHIPKSTNSLPHLTLSSVLFPPSKSSVRDAQPNEDSGLPVWSLVHVMTKAKEIDLVGQMQCDSTNLNALLRKEKGEKQG